MSIKVPAVTAASLADSAASERAPTADAKPKSLEQRPATLQRSAKAGAGERAAISDSHGARTSLRASARRNECLHTPRNILSRLKVISTDSAKTQHKAACKRADIDLITIMHMDGWKSLRMVQRYASVGTDHMRESINKLN